jgi:predicted transcriptional regulator
MTDLTALTEIIAPTTDDLVYVVDDPASGKNPKKCSIANLVDARTKTLTNTTIDADGTGNSITNIENADIKSSAAIAYSKLNLTGNVADGDLAGSIAQSKITNLSTDLSGKSPTAGNSSLTTVGAIGTGTWESTDVAVAHGGTGSSTASAARTALGVAIGSDVQAFNSATALTTNTLNDFAVPTASLALGTQKITGLVAGVADSDAANKGQVDAAQAGLDAKSACRVATTADVTTWVYNNVAKTLTAAGNGIVTIDSIPLLINDRILVKDQSPANENGLYSVTTVGTASATQVLTRTTDADEDDEVTSGLYTFITEGTDNGSTGFVLVTSDPITVGTTLLSFSQFSGLAQLIGGTAITKTGNTINADVGIANDELPQFTTGAVDDDFLRIAGTRIEGLNASEVLTAIGASPTAGNSSLTTVGALSTGGTIVSGFGNIDNGTSTISTGQVDIVAEGDLRLQDATGGQFVAVEAPATVTTYTVKLPAAIGAAGEALKVTSVAGTTQTMEWGTAGGLGDELTTKLQAVGYSAANQSPATEGTSAVSFFVKTIDSNNQGVYVRIKKNNAYTDVQIA